MPDSIFHFKQFSVKQDKSVMKVGTDGVLLGASATPGNSRQILDIGTGTGLLALMLAQKSTGHITAIEIDYESYKQASDNFDSSPWKDRLTAIHKSLQDFVPANTIRYDFIISNPPYFADAAKAPNEARNNARHLDETLSIKDLIAGVKKMLTPDGIFHVIFPYREGMIFYEQAILNNLFCNYVIRVKTKPYKLEKRIIMTFSQQLKIIEEKDLILTDEDNNATEQYIELTKDYYLNLQGE